MTQEILGYMRDHTPVVYDPVHSHAATHFADTPGLKELVQEIIPTTLPTGEYMWFETDMGRMVGVTSLTETDETDEIVYAKRLNRDTYTRFTKSRKPQPCPIVTVAMMPQEGGVYLLKSAWVGPVGYSFPDEPDAQPESHEYWSSHALVWGTQEIQPGTETSVSPW